MSSHSGFLSFHRTTQAIRAICVSIVGPCWRAATLDIPHCNAVGSRPNLNHYGADRGLVVKDQGRSIKRTEVPLLTNSSWGICSTCKCRFDKRMYNFMMATGSWIWTGMSDVIETLRVHVTATGIWIGSMIGAMPSLMRSSVVYGVLNSDSWKQRSMAGL